ncbi:PQQ-dependent sugar dehydrogenase [Nocardioides mesophilus]|uniref:PQQ-dependent sugar dehydrogenase n=1 Tax=Nocardioides mesophilus TaxID=433659 RepID=A0A7G9RF06_9ACTN|nr:PQQ-dependent sugar dehydrogenase [Nocardioides mesophilus]QNN54181.1 PQQ-dependent sugar dehydrogenase [Nocardioides mesophilus]
MTELDRRTLFKAAAAAGVAVPGAALLGAGPAAAAPRVTQVLARDLEVPWGLAFLPGGDALVGERMSGDVHRVLRTGGRRRVGRVGGVRANAGEGGLLGLACSPTFHRDRWVYAFLSAASDNRIVRMRYVDGALRHREPVLAGIPTRNYHNGGRLRFGPDGLLYASTGDAGDPQRAASTGSLAGKVLRMTPGGGVPSGNPFGNHVWSFNHRNVEGLAFDGRGRLWATELGEKTYDELNRILPGRDYGWSYSEGPDGPGGAKDPFVTWTPTSSCSPSGIAVVRGQAWIGALAGRALMRVDLAGDGRRSKHRFLHDRFGRIRTVERAPDGSLWITTSNRDGRGDPARHDDKVIRVRV